MGGRDGAGEIARRMDGWKDRWMGGLEMDGRMVE